MMRWAPALLLAGLMGACGPSMAPAWPDLGETSHAYDHIASFAGVYFGENLTDVRERIPNGTDEVSPFGVPSYRVDRVSHGGIQYRTVIYEFPKDQGMQLVYARFAASQRSLVFSRLSQILGPPSSCSRCPLSAQTVATWHTKDGGVTIFDARNLSLSVSTAQGSNLIAEIKLRDQILNPSEM